jgi:hypothetical protein
MTALTKTTEDADGPFFEVVPPLEKDLGALASAILWIRLGRRFEEDDLWKSETILNLTAL